MIPISAVVLGEDEERLVVQVLRSGQLAQGPMVDRLERDFATYCGTRHAVAVANGTMALVAALRVLGVGPGDEVVTSAFTFVATLNAILECGALARFADIDPSTYNIDGASLAEACTGRTRVVMPVHLYGQPADMASVVTIAERHGAAIIEDAAQAHGAAIDGRRVGGFGVATFSFYATKNITTGEGGVVTTDDDDIADRLRLLRNHGMRARYEYESVGTNFRLTDVQAAIALPQLERLDATIERRQANAARLTEGLAGIEGLVTPVVTPGFRHVFHQYTIRVTEDAALDRDALAAQLASRGVQSGIYYPRVVFDYDCYRRHPNVVATEVPRARAVAREVLSLPVHTSLSDADLDCIVESVRVSLGAEPRLGAPMKIAPVRIAIVGSGAMGALHARVVSQSMEAELACVIDPDREAGEALAERWRSRWFPDLDSFRGIDALIVASPTASHVEWATRALCDGKPVLVEKPIAEDLAQVDALLDVARRQGVPLSCGLLERFNSAILTAVEIVDDPTHAVSVRHSPYLPRIASGVAYDLLIHDVDLMLRLAGRVPDDVTAHFSYAHPYSQPGAEDVIEASLQFEGMLAALSASRISQRKVRSLVIYELERMIEVDLVRQDITVYRHVGADFLEDGGHGYRQQTVMDIPVVQNAREPLVSQLEHFVALASGEADAAQELETLRPPHAVVAKIVEVGRDAASRATDPP